MTMFFGLKLRDLAVFRDHLDLALSEDLADAVIGVDLVFLQQEGNAADIGVDHVLLVLHHRRQIELGLVHLDAQLLKTVVGLFEHFGRVQQRLGRDAADVEAGATVAGTLFDNGNLHAELSCLDRANVAPGAGSDHYKVIGHGTFPLFGGLAAIAAATEAALFSNWCPPSPFNPPFRWRA